MIMTWDKRSTRRETCPRATLFITNPTGLELNPDLRGRRPVIGLVSHGTAFSFLCGDCLN
jgi:hypothetical protein